MGDGVEGVRRQPGKGSRRRVLSSAQLLHQDALVAQAPQPLQKEPRDRARGGSCLILGSCLDRRLPVFHCAWRDPKFNEHNWFHHGIKTKAVSEAARTMVHLPTKGRGLENLSVFSVCWFAAWFRGTWGFNSDPHQGKMVYS